MRPAAFHSLSVRRCVRQSRRLWIWIRSSRCARIRLSDCSICATPASRPLVQTFVARKSLSVIPSSAARSPTTDSAAPYIGDESTTRPPNSTRLFSTSLSGARSAGESPTSKTRHVPSPTIGIASLLDRMGRLIGCEAARAPDGKAPAAISASTRRREIPSTRASSPSFIPPAYHDRRAFLSEEPQGNPGLTKIDLYQKCSSGLEESDQLRLQSRIHHAPRAGAVRGLRRSVRGDIDLRRRGREYPSPAARASRRRQSVHHGVPRSDVQLRARRARGAKLAAER